MTDFVAVATDEVRIAEAMAVLGLATSPGRTLVLAARKDCVPCQFLKVALKRGLGPEAARRLQISSYEIGDTACRSAHLRLGAKTYPAVFLVEDGLWRGVVEGYSEIRGRPDTSAHLAFIADGTVPQSTAD